MTASELYLFMNLTIFSIIHSRNVRHEKMYFSQLLPILPLCSYVVLLWINTRIILTKISSARINEPIAKVPKWYTRVMKKELQRGDLGIFSLLPLAK